MKDAKVWYEHLWEGEKQRFRWSQDPSNSYKARQASLFHRHKPVISYDYDELDEPWHNGTVSMWEMCAGLLGHVHFTLPLTKNANGQYVPTTLNSSNAQYNPYTPSTTPNLTALESFIVQVTKDAFDVSPFYRHYGMYHLASNSAGCGDYAATKTNPVPPKSKYTFEQAIENGHGISSFYYLSGGSNIDLITNVSRRGILDGLLGKSPRHTCFCGYDYDNGQCILPSIIQDYILSNPLPPTPDMAYLKSDIVSSQRGRFFLNQNERVQRTLKAIWQPGVWPCPELDVSDHWGIVKDKDAWTISQVITILFKLTP